MVDGRDVLTTVKLLGNNMLVGEDEPLAHADVYYLSEYLWNSKLFSYTQLFLVYKPRRRRQIPLPVLINGGLDLSICPEPRRQVRVYY